MGTPGNDNQCFLYVGRLRVPFVPSTQDYSVSAQCWGVWIGLHSEMGKPLCKALGGGRRRHSLFATQLNVPCLQGTPPCL